MLQSQPGTTARALTLASLPISTSSLLLPGREAGRRKCGARCAFRKVDRLLPTFSWVALLASEQWFGGPGKRRHEESFKKNGSANLNDHPEGAPRPDAPFFVASKRRQQLQISAT